MDDFYRQYIRTGAIGLEVGLSIIVGAGIGYWIDERYGFGPWGMILGTVFGVLAAAKTLWKFAKAYLKEHEKD